MTQHAVARRRPPVKCAAPVAELSVLGLDQLRAYRATLSAEEDRVSYWGRLLNERVDLLRDRAPAANTMGAAHLIRALGDTGTGRSRRALMSVPAPARLPDLPDLDQLAQLWAAEPADADQVTHVVERLVAEQTRLSDYRAALHQRIDAAASELIVRYRADPWAALALLPQP